MCPSLPASCRGAVVLIGETWIVDQEIHSNIFYNKMYCQNIMLMYLHYPFGLLQSFIICFPLDALHCLPVQMFSPFSIHVWPPRNLQRPILCWVAHWIRVRQQTRTISRQHALIQDRIMEVPFLRGDKTCVPCWNLSNVYFWWVGISSSSSSSR